MTERIYIGTFKCLNAFGGGYGGESYCEVEYFSYSRAGSKQNKEDAIAAYRRKHGRSGSVYLESTRLIKDY